MALNLADRRVLEFSYKSSRQRLRDRFLEGEAADLSELEFLELLLGFSISMADVRPIAQRLIRHLGSFSKIINAPPEVLEDVLGLGKESVTLIRLIKGCAQFYLRDKCFESTKIHSLTALIDYCRLSMGDLKDEQFRVILLNTQNEIIAEEIFQEGTVSQTVVYPRKVLELALKHKASGLILIHNHPSGNLTPSSSDLDLTRTLVKAGRALNLTVIDHLIICSQGYLSLAEQNML